LQGGIEGRLNKFKLTEEQTEGVSKIASVWLIHLLRTVIPHFIKLVNITSLVEQKINSLDLAEVEELLFSFMKNHFKWINILGFLIGFFVGAVQAGIILLNRYTPPQ
ncbi:MAG: DUF445 family protein, partial [Deferribacteraceae bacterium]|jgi:uncharacterized membrane protein YheB (UPF0754 family)|nr:DUF445 family protein [Deferribacteraceae bacterium]